MTTGEEQLVGEWRLRCTVRRSRFAFLAKQALLQGQDLTT